MGLGDDADRLAGGERRYEIQRRTTSRERRDPFVWVLLEGRQKVACTVPPATRMSMCELAEGTVQRSESTPTGSFQPISWCGSRIRFQRGRLRRLRTPSSDTGSLFDSATQRCHRPIIVF